MRERGGRSYRHAVERQLAMNFELVGGRHPTTRVQNDIIELRERERERDRETERQREREREFNFMADSFIIAFLPSAASPELGVKYHFYFVNYLLSSRFFKAA